MQEVGAALGPDGDEEGYLEAILAHLSARQVSQACVLAQEKGEWVWVGMGECGWITMGVRVGGCVAAGAWGSVGVWVTRERGRDCTCVDA